MLSMALESMNILDQNHVEKVALARKVGRFLRTSEDAHERAVVENIAKVLINDVSQLVRQSLVFELQTCEALSEELREQISSDVYDVSGPFLEVTEQITEGELAELVPIVEERVRASIARRPFVSERVADKIIEVGQQRSVKALARNEGAEISEAGADRMIQRFGADKAVMNSLARRESLPPAIAKKLMDKVADKYKEALVQHYNVEVPVAEEIASDTKAVSLGTFLATADIKRVRGYVRDLKQSGRLQADLILSLTNRSNVRFFCVAMSEKLGVPLEKLEPIVRSGRSETLLRILQRAHFPAKLYAPIQAAVRAKLLEEGLDAAQSTTKH